MTSDTSLLINLARNAPWLIEGETDLFPEALHGSVAELMEGIRDNRLAIITDDGQLYEQYQHLEIIDGGIKIEKPAHWKDSTGSFHVFFINKDSRWNFFPAQNTVCHPSALRIDQPEKIYLLQRRRYKRVLAPIGTRATFIGLNGIDSVYVQDISEGGMQVCINSAKDKYPTGSIINDIFITSLPKRKKNQANSTRRTIPLINSGKVVRSFYDQEQSLSYYGIFFSSDSVYVKEGISRMINALEGDLPSSNAKC